MSDQGEQPKISRRDFLKVSGITALSALLSACSAPDINSNAESTEAARKSGKENDLANLENKTKECLDKYTYQIVERISEETTSSATAFSLGAVCLDDETALEFLMTNQHVVHNPNNTIKINNDSIYPEDYAKFDACISENGLERDLSVVVVKRHFKKGMAGTFSSFWHSVVEPYTPTKGDEVYFRGFQVDQGFTAKGEVASGLIKNGVKVQGELASYQGFEIHSGEIQGGGGSGSAVYKDGKIVAIIFSGWESGDRMYAVPVADALKRIFIGKDTSGQTIAQKYNLPQDRFSPLFGE